LFDADSVMRGETLVDLVKLMEAHPGVGLIQTVPALMNAESLFGRIQQFANRLYAPVFITGLNYWAQGLRQLLGPQRHHPHRAVHAMLRPAAIARAQAVRRPDSEP
jgi:membrane glycosyltransferase